MGIFIQSTSPKMGANNRHEECDKLRSTQSVKNRCPSCSCRALGVLAVFLLCCWLTYAYEKKYDYGIVLPLVGLPEEFCHDDQSWMKNYTIQTEYGCDDFEEMEKTWTKIAHGNQRDVYFAEYDGKKIVVKVLKDIYKSVNHDDFKASLYSEAVALSLLRNASNIVQQVGRCHSNIAAEWLPVDLQKLPHHELTENQRILLSLGMAEGLAQLHSVCHGPFLHHDLRLKQWMLDPNGVVKLGDLNAGWFLPRNAQGERCVKETEVALRTTDYGLRATAMRWLGSGLHLGSWRAPEEFLNLPLDEKADVFVLGLSIWALFKDGKKESPYPNHRAGAEGYDSSAEYVIAGGRPQVDEQWPALVQDVLTWCWADAPAARPGAGEVAQALRTLVEARGLGPDDRYHPPG